MRFHVSGGITRAMIDKSVFTFLLVAASIAIAAPPPDFRFKVELLAEGMPQPMHLQRLDDGRIFFSEIAGKIRLTRPGKGIE